MESPRAKKEHGFFRELQVFCFTRAGALMSYLQTWILRRGMEIWTMLKTRAKEYNIFSTRHWTGLCCHGGAFEEFLSKGCNIKFIF